MASVFQLSEYANSLPIEAKIRYKTKLNIVGLHVDPYVMPTNEFTSEPDEIPKISWMDMSSYFLLTPSLVTKEQVKALKSLNSADSFAQSGWIKEMKLKKFQFECKSRFIIIGKVMHSQRLSEKPLNPWFACEADGEILAGHCTCMAGLGEVCSHVAALLSAVVKVVAIRDQSESNSCTSKPCAWLPATKEVKPAKLKDINFGAKKMKCDSKESPLEAKKISPPTAEELKSFMDGLASQPEKAVILRVMPDHASDFVPSPFNAKFPAPLSDLYEPKALSLPYLELLKISEIAFSSIVVSQQSADAIEEATRSQTGSPIWFSQRSGRITASLYRDVLHSQLGMPPASLVKKICYPASNKFSTAATSWGCEHEKSAKEEFMTHYKSHANAKIVECGLLINTQFPHLGASPDALINCDCCGLGVLEVKCPFCIREELIQNLHDKQISNFCMEQRDGKWCLKSQHAYFYQVQLQMFISRRSFCYFVVWTEKDMLMEKIYADSNIILDTLPVVNMFYLNGVLPEMIGKWYTRLPATGKNVLTAIENEFSNHTSNNITSAVGDDELWCYCHNKESGKMIFCENTDCNIKWFHCTCLKMTIIPKGKWICPSCSLTKRKRKAPVKKCNNGK